MAKINNKQDWINEAEKIIPKIKPYVDKFGGINGIETQLQQAFNAKQWKTLHGLFEQIWSWLPDSHEIQITPFYDLCDLCSEVWVFDETEQKEQTNV
jgi:hypothetical protein